MHVWFFPFPSSHQLPVVLGVCLVCSSAVHAGLAGLTLYRTYACSPCHHEFIGAASDPAVSGEHYLTMDVQSLCCLESSYPYENHTTETIVSVAFRP